MELEKIKLADLEEAEYNPRWMSSDEMGKLKNSIETFGVVEPILINLKENNRIIGGHQRYNALIDLYYEDNEFNPELNLIRLNDSLGWVFPNNENELADENYEKALNLALNKISGEWVESDLKTLLEELQLSELEIELTGFDEIEIEELAVYADDETGESDGEGVENDRKYGIDITPPHYEPKGDEPAIDELYNEEKVLELEEEIKNADIPDDIKDFLIKATRRHRIFNYDKIAEFYCHQPPEIQELMEKSALVIIDIENAIANGYVEHNKYITNLIEENHERFNR